MIFGDQSQVGRCRVAVAMLIRLSVYEDFNPFEEFQIKTEKKMLKWKKILQHK